MVDQPAGGEGWFVTNPQAGGAPVGPYPAAYFQQLTEGGYVTLDTPVWREGRPAWDKIADVEELRAIVASVPAASITRPQAGAAAPSSADPAANVAAKGGRDDEDGELAAFRAEVAAAEAEAAAEAAAAARAATPDELEFEEDDGTRYVWDREARRYMPASGEAAAGAEAAAGGAADGYDIAAMTFAGDDEIIPTLATAPAPTAGTSTSGAAEEGGSGRGRGGGRGGGGAAGSRGRGAGRGGGDGAADEPDANKRKADAFIAEQQEKAAKRREHKQKQQEAAWKDIKNNTSVYVTGLPSDTTVAEVAAAFSKCGIIKDDASGQPRIKLYKDKESGVLKGDALVTYFKEPSVNLAVTILDGAPLRPEGAPMTVTVAKFELKGEYQPRPAAQAGQATKPAGKKGGGKGKKPSALDRKLGWGGFDDLLPPEKVTVVIRHMFTQEEALQTLTLAEDLQEEATEECGRMGAVDKVRVCRHHPEGVVTVKFKTEDGAQACLQRMDGRFFAGRRLEAAMWDGITNYNVKPVETEEEQQARLEAFSAALEQGAAASGGAAAGGDTVGPAAAREGGPPAAAGGAS